MRKPGSRFPLSLDQVKPSPAKPREATAVSPAAGLLRPQRLLHEAARDAAHHDGALDLLGEKHAPP